MKEGHLGQKAEPRCSTRKHLALYGLEKAELQLEGHGLVFRYVPLTEYRRPNPVTTSSLSVDTTGDKKIFQRKIGSRVP